MFPVVYNLEPEGAGMGASMTLVLLKPVQDSVVPVGGAVCTVTVVLAVLPGPSRLLGVT